MPLRTALAALIVLAAGCGDPNRRLVRGEPCLIASSTPGESRVLTYINEDSPLHIGDRVSVLDDTFDDNPTGMRLVAIKIETGTRARDMDMIHRTFLQPQR